MIFIVFHTGFNWALLQGGQTPGNESAIIAFIKAKYNLTNEQARAYINGVSMTGLEFDPNGNITANTQDLTTRLAAPINIQDINSITIPPQNQNIQWAANTTDQEKIDAFKPKFAMEENNEYHTFYAKTVLKELDQYIPYASVFANNMNGDWVKKIGGFEIKKYGFAFDFHTDVHDPARTTSRLTGSRTELWASNGEDCVLDALAHATGLAMQASPQEWPNGVNLDASNDELLKSAGIFRQAGLKLDADTKQRVRDLFAHDPRNEQKFKQYAYQAAQRWQNTGFTQQMAAALTP